MQKKKKIPTEALARKGSVDRIWARSLASTHTRERMISGIIAGDINEVGQIGLTEGEEEKIREKTAVQVEKRTLRLEERNKQKKDLESQNLMPLTDCQTWQIVVHTEEARQADLLLKPDKRVILSFREGGLQQDASLDEADKDNTPSNSGELHEETKKDLENTSGDIAVILAGSNLRGCMMTTFRDIYIIGNKREMKTDIHILLPDTVDQSWKY
ncbi:MAG: hypothetical protein U0946_03175 [Patescibacteria group bacterium]|nr:hypothetical protein [Patescibacteria group bacterium]